ncbi:ankyrin repeat-containing protein BDA1-like [Aristolochia californica]|uniref:ankyrin repeat-containing protein BDA1-like n=1 Tax=Aristolochia californica TaxID=171875 RepID=UPI0035E23C41
MANIRERTLNEAALMGSVAHLQSLLQEDPYLLHRIPLDVEKKNTPLHFACVFGHLEFVKEILFRNPELVSLTNRQGSSPLHLASGNGQLELVKVLLEIDANLCLTQDQQGMTPVHVAAKKGQAEVLRELVGAKPIAIWIFTDQGETALHLGVRYNHLEALRMLVQTANDEDLENWKDDEGNTILHLATSKRHTEIIHFLITNTRIKVNELNSNGLTALDVLEQIPSKFNEMEVDTEIAEIIVEHRAKRGRDITTAHDCRRRWKTRRGSSLKKHSQMLTEMRSAVLILSSLVATATFQIGVNPPGGVWQDDSKNSTGVAHVAGKAIMATKGRSTYINFICGNTLAFLLSLLLIVQIVNGSSLKGRYLPRGVAMSLNIVIGNFVSTYFTGMFSVW